ncbi:hypothetical protein [Sulfitobacter faviae]|uniref:hypothetical protein n=1 Tax=Sulfitobacter faviae TaxID=1775881 RepID=UPI002455F64E|nr:hypothetical protein [Sulfitobacter faviae]
MTDDSQKIATIDPAHNVALFTPDAKALEQAASAGMKTVVNFRASDEKGGLSPMQSGWWPRSWG